MQVKTTDEAHRQQSLPNTEFKLDKRRSAGEGIGKPLSTSLKINIKNPKFPTERALMQPNRHSSEDTTKYAKIAMSQAMNKLMRSATKEAPNDEAILEESSNNSMTPRNHNR